MKQTESTIPKKESTSYWEGSPASWKKWLGRVLLSLLALYYGWGLTLIVEARSVPALFVIVFAVLPIIWPFWLCFLVELGMSWLPVVIASLAVLVWASIQVVRAKTRKLFFLSVAAIFIVFLGAIAGCVVHGNGMASWSP